MPFLSFAQNFEDVLIARCFEEQTGTYVDVGSHHPVLDSTTCAFYQRGWRGLSIDALDTHQPLFERLRTEDTNLVSAVGAAAGALTFYVLPGTGLSTLDEAIAARHSEAGFVVEKRETPVETLATLLERHAIADIDFLKIDVEGAERAVIEGMDWQRWRPKLVIVEATAPMSPVRNSQDWSDILVEARYHFVFFDGLNEYWVSDESQSLRDHFNAPANVFDQYLRAREWVLLRSFHDAGFRLWLQRLLPIFQAGTSFEKEYASHRAALDKLPPTEDASLIAKRLARTVLGASELITPEALTHAESRSGDADSAITEWMQTPSYLELLVWGHAMLDYRPQKWKQDEPD